MYNDSINECNDFQTIVVNLWLWFKYITQQFTAATLFPFL